MMKTRYYLNLSFDILLGFLILGMTIGVVILLSTPTTPQVLSDSTNSPSTSTGKESDVQQVVLLPAHPSISYSSISPRSIPDQSSVASTAPTPSQPNVISATPPPSVAVATPITFDGYIGILAIATAILITFNSVQYLFGKIYRLGIPEPEYLKKI